MPKPNKVAPCCSVSTDPLGSVQGGADEHAMRMLLNWGCQQKPGKGYQPDTSAVILGKAEIPRRAAVQRQWCSVKGWARSRHIPSACSEAVGQECYVSQRCAVLVQCNCGMQGGCVQKLRKPPEPKHYRCPPQQFSEVQQGHVMQRCSVGVACHLLAQHSGALLGAVPKS